MNSPIPSDSMILCLLYLFSSSLLKEFKTNPRLLVISEDPFK